MIPYFFTGRQTHSNQALEQYIRNIRCCAVYKPPSVTNLFPAIALLEHYRIRVEQGGKGEVVGVLAGCLPSY